jgi:hypothetical protein
MTDFFYHAKTKIRYNASDPQQATMDMREASEMLLQFMNLYGFLRAHTQQPKRQTNMHMTIK